MEPAEGFSSVELEELQTLFETWDRGDGSISKAQLVKLIEALRGALEGLGRLVCFSPDGPNRNPQSQIRLNWVFHLISLE